METNKKKRKISINAVLDKDNRSISSEFLKTEIPILIIETKKNKFQIYDFEEERLLTRNDGLKIITYSDEGALFENDQVEQEYVSAVMYKKGNVNYLHVGQQSFDNEHGFVRFDLVNDNKQFPLFIALKNDGDFRFINKNDNNDFSKDTILKSKNPYALMFLDGYSKDDGIFVNFGTSFIIDKVHNYFEGLISETTDVDLINTYELEKDVLFKRIGQKLEGELHKAKKLYQEQSKVKARLEEELEIKQKEQPKARKEIDLLNASVSKANKHMAYAESFFLVSKHLEGAVKDYEIDYIRKKLAPKR